MAKKEKKDKGKKKATRDQQKKKEKKKKGPSLERLHDSEECPITGLTQYCVRRMAFYRKYFDNASASVTRVLVRREWANLPGGEFQRMRGNEYEGGRNSHLASRHFL